ncbi:MAG: Ig-like domain-containing protein, partial [Desulfomonilaceae bacterium]|nr:Ig-like domain-containing protein [Desulfomonilaceae bacterium]
LSDINAAIDGLVFTPTILYTGPASIWAKINDMGFTGAGGPLTAEATVGITVNPAPPLAPTAGDFSASVAEDAVVTLGGWNFTDLNGDAAQSITITGLPTNGTLFVDANGNNQVDAGEAVVLNDEISWTDAVTTPIVKYLGDADYFGPDSLSYVVTDTTAMTGAAPDDEGTVSIDVTPVNDAPTITLPAPQTVTGGAIELSTLNGNAIVFDDIDAGIGEVGVRLKATNGTLTLASVAGLTMVIGDGTDDVDVAFFGTLSDIHAAVDGLIFTANPLYTGPATIWTKINDMGYTGAGNVLVAEATLNLNVV